MQFFRRLSNIKAISFDLDDTLYSNYPVMLATDIKMQTYFDRLLPTSEELYDYHFWAPFRQQALIDEPLLAHDVGKLREQSFYLGLIALGFTEQKAKVMAEQAIKHFVAVRSDFQVPSDVHALLSKLATKWPLIAISNGNVDTKAIGIDHYFAAIYHASVEYKQKPAPDMFAATCQQFNLVPRELLHVGDCGANDVLGALRHGCQAAWVSTYDVGHPIKVLPHFALSDVTELENLI